MANPEQRKKILLYGALGVIVLFQFGDWFYANQIEARLTEKTDRIESLKKTIKKKQSSIRKARDVVDKLEAWEKQSLPTDPDVARSLYRSWLIQAVQESGFESPNIDSGGATNRKGMYYSLSFLLRGQASLDQLTRFLHTFYNADVLHQIRSLTITPIKSKGVLDVSFSIEALILPTANQPAETWVVNKANKLAWDQLSDYRPIVSRDLFRVGGSIDAVSQTVLSGVTTADGRPQAWFTLRASDKVVKLWPGDKLEVGDFAGTVVEIDESDVVLETEGERWVLSIGDNLDAAHAIPPEL